MQAGYSAKTNRHSLHGDIKGTYYAGDIMHARRMVHEVSMTALMVACACPRRRAQLEFKGGFCWGLSGPYSGDEETKALMIHVQDRV